MFLIFIRLQVGRPYLHFTEKRIRPRVTCSVPIDNSMGLLIPSLCPISWIWLDVFSYSLPLKYSSDLLVISPANKYGEEKVNSKIHHFTNKNCIYPTKLKNFLEYICERQYEGVRVRVCVCVWVCARACIHTKEKEMRSWERSHLYPETCSTVLLRAQPPLPFIFSSFSVKF